MPYGDEHVSGTLLLNLSRLFYASTMKEGTSWSSMVVDISQWESSDNPSTSTQSETGQLRSKALAVSQDPVGHFERTRMVFSYRPPFCKSSAHPSK